MNIVPCSQGDSTWLKCRAGRVTASRVADAIAINTRGDMKGVTSATRETYKAEIVAEILSGNSADHFVSQWMDRGTEQEPFARAAYEMRHGVLVEQVGFVIHPEIARAGASPDGYIPGVRGVEFKVPKIETHLRYMLDQRLPPEYEPQVMFGLACCRELPEWDFVSYCPELPERHQQFLVKVPRDEQRISEIDNGVRRFLMEVDELLEKIDKLNLDAPQTSRLQQQLQDSLNLTGDWNADLRTIADSLHGDVGMLQ